MSNLILTPQGTINRVRGSIVFGLFPQLNITASFLGTEGISVNFSTKATDYIPTMTGAATSPAPYQIMLISAMLLRTQPFADLWKTTVELSSLLGDITVRTDAAPLSPYIYTNCALDNVGDIKSDGKTIAYMIHIIGTYSINAALFA